MSVAIDAYAIQAIANDGVFSRYGPKSAAKDASFDKLF
jgi:hypothetical protein